MRRVKKLQELFEKYDREHERLLEHVRRERMIKRELKKYPRWPHVDEPGRPE